LHTTWQQKVFTKLLGLNYKIVYKRGVDNSAADALSRRPMTEQLLALSSVTPQWLEDIVAGYQSDPQALELLSKLAVASASDSHFSLLNGLIRYNDKIWIGTHVQLQKRVFSALHSSYISSNLSTVLLAINEIRHYAVGAIL